jgi:hypothetical protein
MPEIAERDEFCQVEVANEDWFTSADVMPFWTQKNFRRMLEGMWEKPRPKAKLNVIVADRALEERLLESSQEVLCPGIPTSAADWPIRTAQTVAPSRIDWLTSEILEVARESALSVAGPIDENTQRAAIRFAGILPSFVPVPEIAADPDGEVSFDWIGNSNNMFSVSVDRNGRLAYAGRFSEGRRINGVEQLSAVCPPEIVLGIEKASN